MKALIVVDAQYDFMPASEEAYKNGMGGALAVTDGDQIVPIINELLPEYKLVIFTKDWHPSDNIYFAATHGKEPFEQMELNGRLDTLWPVHCVQNTRGADLHDDINFGLINGEFFIIKKGQTPYCHPYGGFGDMKENTGLNDLLLSKFVTDIDIVGLALDYCVKDTALSAANYGYNTRIFIEGTRPIDLNINELLLEFDEAGVVVEELYADYT